MKHALISTFFLVCIVIPLFVQNANESNDKLTIKLQYGKNSVPGIKIVVKDTPIATMSDYQGVASLSIPPDKNILFVEVLSSYFDLEVIRPVDSIVFDMKSGYAVYYYMNKKQARKKQYVPHF